MTLKPTGKASNASAQIVLRTKLGEDNYSVEPLVPPGSFHDFQGKFTESEIELGEDEKLYVKHSRKNEWIEIKGGGGGSTSTQYAIVMEAISQPDDVTAEPPSGMGKIRILGKEYPVENEQGDPIEPEYDDCACLLLAETEQLLNEQVKIIGPFYYNENDEEKKSYYLVIDIVDSYDGLPLESELTHNGTSSIKVQKGEEEDDELEFTVHNGILTEEQYYKAGTPVLVKRTAGKLYVVDGPCPEAFEEEEE